MPKMDVTRKIIIEKPASEVYPLVAEMDNWIKWSPWLIVEPEAKVDVSDNNKYYKWDGKIVGSGEMQVTNESQNEWVDYDLTFLTPWKSHAKIRFDLKDLGGKTEVTWNMQSKLPFFMFFMTKMMNALIGMDFDRGLKMLKDLSETGTVHSKLDRVGVREFDGCNYIGVKRSSKMVSISEDMQADFAKLHQYFSSNPDVKTGKGLSIYHKWKLSKGEMVYTAAMQVDSIPANLPADLVSGTIPKSKVHVVKHTGPYDHIGNAWSASSMMQRSKMFKKNRRFEPFEWYVNSPENTQPNDLVTEIYFGTK